MASQLATALATYFVVDPDDIQSNLVKDTKIVLYKVQVKPQRVSSAVTLTGSVDQIEFRWKWGGDGTTQFVRETVLLIWGVRLHLLVGRADPLHQRSLPDSLQPPKDSSACSYKSPRDANGYVERHVQQILDHLTLEITDVDLTIETAHSPGKLVVDIKSLQLCSFGRLYQEEKKNDSEQEPAPPLSQRLVLEALTVYAVEDNSAHRALLEPFSYAATVSRVSGRRFINFMHGLQVTGQILQPTAQIQVRVGLEQMRVLVPMLQALLDATDMSSSSPSSPARFNEATCTEPGTAVNPEEDYSDDEISDGPSTAFTLPFPEVVVSFADDAKIQIPNCLFKYSIDGSVLSLLSSQGIRINDRAPFLELGEGVSWTLDVAHRAFVVGFSDIILDQEEWADARESLLEEKRCGAVAHVVWNEPEIRRLYSAFVVLQNATRNIVEHGLEIYEHQHTRQTEPASFIPWSVAIEGPVLALLQGEQQEWLKVSLESLSFTFPSSTNDKDAFLDSLKLEGAALGPTSFQNASMHVPSLALDPSDSVISAEAPVKIVLGSITATKQLQSFLIRILCIGGSDPSSPTAYASKTRLPFRFGVPILEVFLEEPKPVKFIVNCMEVDRNCQVTCKSVEWAGSSVKELSGTTRNLSLTGIISSGDIDIHVRIGSIDRLFVPGLLEIKRPVNDITARLSNDELAITSHLIHAALLYGETESLHDAETTDRETVSLPFNVRMRLEGLYLLLPSDAHVVIGFIDLSVIPTTNSQYSIVTCRPITARLEAPNSEFLQSRFDATTLTLSRQFAPEEMECVGFQIGPSSFDEGSVVGSSLKLSQGFSTAQVGGPVKISLGSLDAASRATGFFEESMIYPKAELSHPCNSNFNSPIAVALPEVFVDVSNPMTKLRMQNVEMSGSSFRCKEIALSGAGFLSRNDELLIRGMEIVVTTPKEADPLSPDDLVGAHFSVRADETQNNMAKLTGTHISGILEATATNVISCLSFQTTSATVAAGFSSVEWSKMFSRQEVSERAPWRLPYGKLAPFSANVCYQGKLLSTSSTLMFREFSGGLETTSNDIVKHITKAVFDQMPAFFSNADVMGENVVEMTGKSVGRALLMNSMTGSVAGSVGGLVAVDGIKGAIASGKESRSASRDERYHFGDFSRGTIRSIGQAAKYGGERRRGSHDSYEVGDFTVGASRAIGGYATENKSRLAAAGGSGVGIVVGTMVAGPLGFVAGSYLGGRAGSSIFKDSEKSASRSKGGTQKVDARELLAAGNERTDSVALQERIAPIATDDLLGLGSEAQAPKMSGEPNDPFSLGSSSFVPTTTSPQPLNGGLNVTGLGFADLNPVQPHLGGTTHAATVNPLQDPLQYRPYTPPSKTTQPAGSHHEKQECIPPQPREVDAAVPLQHMEHNSEHRHQYQGAGYHQQYPRQQQQQVKAPPREQGYRFGDLTRSIVTKGKEKDGRNRSDGYKFGDFTRGLFSS